MSYTKLHQSLLTSSVWLLDSDIRVVWITLLAMADQDGIVEGSVPGLARIAGVSREACDRALAVLSAPDEDSRTKTDEGRRLRTLDDGRGWEVINYHEHRARASREEAKTKAAVRQQRKRDRDAMSRAVTGSNGNVTDSNALVTPRHASPKHAKIPVSEANVTQLSQGGNAMSLQAEAEAEAEAVRTESAAPQTAQQHPVEPVENFSSRQTPTHALLLKITHGVLDEAPGAAFAELKEAVKCRC